MTVGVSTPRWAPDPVGRFAQRYWDGARWTEHVAGAAGGAPQTDLLPDPPVVPPVDPAQPAAPPSDRNGHGSATKPRSDRPATPPSTEGRVPGPGSAPAQHPGEGGTQHPSLTCTATLPGVSDPGGICARPGTDGRYAMFQTRGNIVEVTIVTGHAESDAQLAQLAQVGASRSA